ncbi:MAG: hypothetical protein MZU84_02270 [Sphingobacterium sp.]|nr:hypothetical protein [Sphingobacterium sp.]
MLVEFFSRKGEAFLMMFIMLFVTAVLATFWARFAENAYIQISAPLAMNLLLVTVFSTVLRILGSDQPAAQDDSHGGGRDLHHGTGVRGLFFDDLAGRAHESHGLDRRGPDSDRPVDRGLETLTVLVLFHQ